MGQITMQILVVEDNQDFLVDLVQALCVLPGVPEIKVAVSRDTALEMVEQGFFDLIVLDLTIPTIDGALDATIEHGNAVFAKSQEIAPGTPIFILTGSSADEIFSSLLERKETVDIWGEQTRRGTIDFLPKRLFDELRAKISPVAAAVQALSDVEIKKAGKPFQLNIAEDRLVRSFTRRRGGTRCVLAELSGGLSDTRVFRATVFDQAGSTRINAVAKMGSHAAIQAEALRYDREMSRLSSNATPRRLETAEFGGKNMAVVFYGLAGGYGRSLFQVAIEAPAMVANIITQIEDLTAPWRDRVPESRSPIARIRRRVLDDTKFRELAATFSLDWVAEFERRDVQTRQCTIHGDLHGGNVLVNENGGATLIDYGDVGEGAAPLDPITLELSYFFHPDGPLRESQWPTPAQARMWGTEDYLNECPMPEISRGCKRWADAVCAGHREIAAVAYAYLVRQLKYAETDKERVLNLLTGARAFFDTT
jgi:CheY-like chemotaxis protein